MTERPLSEVLQDILDAIADIEMFTAEVDFEAFRHNREKVLYHIRIYNPSYLLISYCYLLCEL